MLSSEGIFVDLEPDIPRTEVQGVNCNVQDVLKKAMMTSVHHCWLVLHYHVLGFPCFWYF